MPATLVANGLDLSGTTAQRPTNAAINQPYYDTETGEFLVWNGTAWQAPGSQKLQVSFVYGETTPLDAAFFVAPANYTVTKITARPLVVGSDGSAVTATIRKAPSGTAMASGTLLHTGSIDLKGSINTNQDLTLEAAANIAIAAGDAIGIDVTGTTTAARGVITVELSPAGADIVVSYVYGEATPLDNSFFVAPRACVVKSIRVRPLVVGSDGGAVTAVIKKVASGAAIASGTALHSSSADLKGTINTNQTLTLSSTPSDIAIAAGNAIGMDVTGTMTAARGVVTVTLTPT